jgi:hypothetical protein
MDKSRQRILIKYFSMKGLDSRLICRETKPVLHDSAYRLSAMERWFNQFKTGVAKCEENPGPGELLSGLGSYLTAFLLEFPFASTHQMSRHLRTSHSTIKEILSHQLGLRKFSRRWVTHRLSDDQKVSRARDSRALLAIFLRF